MQSPLTPQRGRIESNPREYTHMGPRLCGELKTMPTDWTMPSARLLHERGFPDEIIGTADDFLDRHAALPSAARNSAGVRPPSASLRLSVL